LVKIKLKEQSKPPRFSSAGSTDVPSSTAGVRPAVPTWADRARNSGLVEVVVEARRKTPAAPGISTIKVNPNRRLMVIRTVPTRDNFHKKKLLKCINARLEVTKAKWIIVAVYGNSGGDLTLHVSDNATAKDGLKHPDNRAIEQGLNDAGYFGFELSADAEKIKFFVAAVSLGKDWSPEDWNQEKYTQLWEEIRASNPKLEIPFLPSFCGTLLNIHKSGRS
jgi:hypothetical protein